MVYHEIAAGWSSWGLDGKPLGLSGSGDSTAASVRAVGRPRQRALRLKMVLFAVNWTARFRNRRMETTRWQLP